MVCVLDVVVGGVLYRVVSAGDAIDMHCVEDEVRFVVV